MENGLQEAVNFFKSEKIYDELFKAFRKKYESLGRIGGTVSVAHFSEDKLEELGRFFGLPGEQLKVKRTIALRAFEEQLANTRFSNVHLKQLLDAYFGETLISKKEQQSLREANLRKFLDGLKRKYPEISFWLVFLEKQRKEGRWIVQIAENQSDHFKSIVAILHQAFISLPIEAERLPMFSQRITGDPHAFDLQTDVGRMFIHLLAVDQLNVDTETEMEIPSSTEEINELLQKYLIYRDDLLNFVTCANIIAETERGVHPVWEAASKAHTVQIVPLRELVSLVKVRPVVGEQVWIVENSGVCATLLDHAPNAPMICTNGQFTLASFILMDLLVKAGYMLHYAGDFDPEGLGMAQRLVDRYGDSVRLWLMDGAAYKKAKSNKELTSERLEKLNSITDMGLLQVAGEMRRSGKAGYQEALVDWMLEDIKNSNSKFG